MSQSERRTDRCPIHPRPQHRGRYAALKTTTDQTFIYDTKNTEAWLQSSFSIAIENME